MNIIKEITKKSLPFGRDWVNQTRQEIGADLMGVLAVRPDSHKDFLYGVKALLPTAKAAIILAKEYDSETMNLIKHPRKYMGQPKTGELLSPHVNQLIEEINQSCYDLSRRLKKQGYRTMVLPSRGLPFRPGQMKAVPFSQ